MPSDSTLTTVDPSLGAPADTQRLAAELIPFLYEDLNGNELKRYIWRVRSDVATLRGDGPAARTWAKLVTEANERYNAPVS